MIELKVARSSRPTGEILRGLLAARNISGGNPPDAVVCYGVGYEGELPSLNKRCSELDKYQQLVKLHESGINVPLFSRQAAFISQTDISGGAVLARKLQHFGGKDIRVCLQEEDAANALQNGYSFFTKYIPRSREFRVWSYRRRHLRTYEKFLAHPELYRSVGCNNRNGWAFRIMPAGDVPREAAELGARAVDSLGLDFGATDILLGKDGRYYVLEVNTAPGVDSAREGISALADKIAKWVELGYPKRRGEE